MVHRLSHSFRKVMLSIIGNNIHIMLANICEGYLLYGNMNNTRTIDRSLLLSLLCFIQYAFAAMNIFHKQYNAIQNKGSNTRRNSVQNISFYKVPVEKE